MYIEAIESCDLYTKKQKLVLSALVEASINNIAKISPRTLSEITGATQPVVYKAVRRFQEENILTPLETPNNKLGIFQLHKDKLDELAQIHKKTKKLKNK